MTLKMKEGKLMPKLTVKQVRSIASKAKKKTLKQVRYNKRFILKQGKTVMKKIALLKRQLRSIVK